MLYKYWIFYLRDTNEIYGFTDNKEQANLFKNQRDKEKFYCEKKYLTQDKVHTLLSDFHDKNFMDYEFKIFDRKQNEYYKPFKVVINMNEYIFINNYSISLMNNIIFLFCWENPKIFNKEIQKALKVINYSDVYNLMNDMNENSNFYDIDGVFKPDYFGIFVRYYGQTLRKDMKI